jgi:YVTN family beta-propeller protein
MGVDPAARFTALLPEPAPPLAEPSAGAPSRRRLAGRPLAIAGLALLVIMAAIGIPLVVHHLDGGLPAIDANAAGIIDPANGHITGQVALGDIPSGIASGAGSVWVALPAKGAVARIDPHTDAVIQQIPVGSNPTGIAFADDAIWVTNSDSRNVSRIDPAANRSVQTISVGNAPTAIAFGAGFVWVTNTLDGTVSKIDPVTDTVKATIPAGASPAAITVGAGSVWVANGASGTVVAIDPTSNRPGGSATVGNGPTSITYDGDWLWVANSQDGTVSRIDPAAGQGRGSVPIGGFPGQLAVGSGAVWAADAGQNTITEIDPGTVEVTRTIHVANSPQALAFAGGMLWVTARGSAASHQGRTLTVVTSLAPSGIDPNAAYDTPTYAFLTNTYDGLLTYARVGGTAGSALVPDLATTIPAPTGDGTTYTFTLRRGIQYSDGSTVEPRDVLRSFERVFRIGAGPSYYLRPLVGAESCSKKACDLSNGIKIDDAKGTVTFHLSAPNAEFIDALALPGLAVVPSSAPRHDIGTHPLPGTGPYMIGTYTRQVQKTTEGTLVTGEVELVKNRSFRQWSPAAQPTGYADGIVFRYGVALEEATSAVERGQADLLLDEPPTDRLHQIETRFSAQSHPFTGLEVEFMFLNTSVSPFKNRDARRALSYAVDRAKMASLLVIPGEGRGGPVTCQALPPNIPGYAPYCPYTQDRSADGAPDMLKAQSLVDRSGTAGTHVTVLSGPAFAADAWYVARVLRELRYHATVKVFPDPDTYYGFVYSHGGVQIGATAWFWDIPAPSNISQVVTCGSPYNLSRFCDPTLDGEIRDAKLHQATDPPAATALWAKIDRRIVNEAPWVPFTNLVGTGLVSARVGNYQHNPVLGVLVGQLWVN